MKKILSIQSHVSYGYVGNRAAVFPLQRLGHDVMAVNTVQFSNHTGYGDWTGEVFSPDHIQDILDGLKRRGALDGLDAVLTGYLGDSAVGEIILSTVSDLKEKPVWLCDPVMGDVGRGFFVKGGVPEFFKNRAMPSADIMTPNQFELEYLSEIKINTLQDAIQACEKLHATGPRLVLLTSLIHDLTQENEINMLASEKNGGRYMVTTPRLPLDPAPNGAGDVTAALFLAHYLETASAETALAKTAGGIFAIFEETLKAESRELALIQAQDKLKDAPRFDVQKVN